MSILTNRRFWFMFSTVLFIMLAAGLSLSNPAQALAATSTDVTGSVNATLSIMPGPLTANVNSISLVNQTTSGSYTTTTYQIGMSVDDATGSGNGWNLALSGGLPSSTMMLTQVNSNCTASSACTLPQNNMTAPTMAQGEVSLNILNAAANTGMGSIDTTATIAVTTPTSANTQSPALTLLISNGTI